MLARYSNELKLFLTTYQQTRFPHATPDLIFVNTLRGMAGLPMLDDLKDLMVFSLSKESTLLAINAGLMTDDEAEKFLCWLEDTCGKNNVEDESGQVSCASIKQDPTHAQTRSYTIELKVVNEKLLPLFKQAYLNKQPNFFKVANNAMNLVADKEKAVQATKISELKNSPFK